MPAKPIPFKVRDLRRKEKSFIDDDYINGWAKHLRPTTTAVYISLCRHADKEQSCFPAHSLIAREHGINRRTVQEKVKLLEEHNIIRRKKIRRKDGTWLNTTYFLVDKSEWKQPREKNSHGSSMGKKLHSHGKILPTKVSHKKDTHTITKVIAGGKPRQDKRNALVDLVIKEFDKVFGFPPIDRKPRFQAYNLIQRFQAHFKQSGKDPTEERLEKAICYYFRNWVANQDSFENTKTLDNIRQNTGVFFAGLKNGGNGV